MVWSFEPFNKIVQGRVFNFSTKVYLSSPKTYSYTSPACPRISGLSSSVELMHCPPHAKTSRSMFLRLARRRAMMFSLHNKSREIGSIPFCVMTTKPLSLPCTLPSSTR